VSRGTRGNVQGRGSVVGRVRGAATRAAGALSGGAGTVRRGVGRSIELLRSGRWTGHVARLGVLALALPLLFSPGTEPRDHAGGEVAGQRDVAPTGDGGPVGAGDGAVATGGGDVAPVGSGDVVDARPVVPAEVRTVQPDLLVRPEQPIEPSALFSVLGLDGIGHLASAAEIAVVGHGPEGDRDQLEALVVDVSAFRPLTPEVTAQTPGVWERLLEGDVVVRHDIADQLSLPLGDEMLLRAAETDPLSVRIGAFASNGAPPLADLIVPWTVGRSLGATDPDLLIVAVEEDEDPEELGARIADLLGGAEVEQLEAPAAERATLEGAGSEAFEGFSYVSHGDGMITIDRDWVNRNIVSAEVPIFRGHVTCHRIMIPQLRAALQEVQAAGLDRYIDPSQYGGCWVPRHILFNPSRPLSMHAWGLAVDFNVSTNQYGARPTLHPGIVEIFERWGFDWGGYWSTPDGMHFELRSVVQP
jgi:hypothetical protein